MPNGTDPLEKLREQILANREGRKESRRLAKQRDKSLVSPSEDLKPSEELKALQERERLETKAKRQPIIDKLEEEGRIVKPLTEEQSAFIKANQERNAEIETLRTQFDQSSLSTPESNIGLTMDVMKDLDENIVQKSFSQINEDLVNKLKQFPVTAPMVDAIEKLEKNNITFGDKTDKQRKVYLEQKIKENKKNNVSVPYYDQELKKITSKIDKPAYRKVGEDLMSVVQLGISLIPKVMMLNLASEPAMKLGGDLGKEIAGETGKDIGETLGHLGLASTLGLPVLLGSLASMGATEVADKLVDGSALNAADKKLIVEAAGHIGFLAGMFGAKPLGARGKKLFNKGYKKAYEKYNGYAEGDLFHKGSRTKLTPDGIEHFKARMNDPGTQPAEKQFISDLLKKNEVTDFTPAPPTPPVERGLQVEGKEPVKKPSVKPPVEKPEIIVETGVKQREQQKKAERQPTKLGRDLQAGVKRIRGEEVPEIFQKPRKLPGKKTPKQLVEGSRDVKDIEKPIITPPPEKKLVPFGDALIEKKPGVKQLKKKPLPEITELGRKQQEQLAITKKIIEESDERTKLFLKGKGLTKAEAQKLSVGKKAKLGEEYKDWLEANYPELGKRPGTPPPLSPEAKRIDEILTKNSKAFIALNEGKSKADVDLLTPDEQKIFDDFTKYTLKPEVKAKYDAGAKDPEIIADYLKQKKAIPPVKVEKPPVDLEVKPAQVEKVEGVEGGTGYFQGDKIRYTGKIEKIHGGDFYEVKMLEGVNKGKIRHVKNPPSVEKVKKKKAQVIGSKKQVVQDRPLTEINVRPEDFQGRMEGSEVGEPFSEESFRKVVAARLQLAIEEGDIQESKAGKIIDAANKYLDKNHPSAQKMRLDDLSAEDPFRWLEFGQVAVWRSPKDNKLYVLSGHSRRAAAEFLQDHFDEFKEIPTIEAEGNTFEEAKQIAQKSNVGGKGEKTTAHAEKFRKFREAGKSKKDIQAAAKAFHGKESSRIINVSFLNRDGDMIQQLRNHPEQMEIVRAADWIGEARQNFSQLTDAHENELYRWLIKDNAMFTKVKSKIELKDTIYKRVTHKSFDPDQPLNLKNVIKRTNLMDDFEADVADAERIFEEAKSDLFKERGKALRRGVDEKELAADEKVKAAQALVDRYQKDLVDLRAKRSDVLEQESRQESLFVAKPPADKLKRVRERLANLEADVFASEQELEAARKEIFDLEREAAQESLDITADIVQPIRTVKPPSEITKREKDFQTLLKKGSVEDLKDYKRILSTEGLVAKEFQDKKDIMIRQVDQRINFLENSQGKGKDLFITKADEEQITMFSARGIKQMQKQSKTEAFKYWFQDSKVVDGKGNPLVVYSGHSNAPLYNNFDPKKSTSGGFYASEDPQVASNYALGKFGNYQWFENGLQYRFKLKNGKFGKKLWQLELTEKQKAKLDELSKEQNDLGEPRFNLEEMMSWAENNLPYEPLARRIMTRGKYNLQTIYEYNEHMGYNIAYSRQPIEGSDERFTFQLQEKSDTELLLDALGIDWQSFDWNQPGVFPTFIKIRNPLDSSLPFPEDLLNGLKEAAKYERAPHPEAEVNSWTKDYPLKEWIKDIESGNDYWTTGIPKKALPVLQKFGYDGIKEWGGKGLPEDQRQVNWIAFESDQIKSAIANVGTFDPFTKDMLLAASGKDSKGRLLTEKEHIQAREYHLDNPMFDNSDYSIIDEPFYVVETRNVWITKHHYDPLQHNFEIIKKGDPEYEQGKEKYRAQIYGSYTPGYEVNNQRSEIRIFAKAGLDATVEEFVHHIQTQIRKTNGNLQQKIDLWKDEVEAAAAAEGVTIRYGNEIFAHSYLSFLGWEELPGDFLRLPPDILEEVNTYASASKTGKDNLATLIKPTAAVKTMFYKVAKAKQGFAEKQAAQMLAAQRPNAPPFYSTMRNTFDKKLPARFTPDMVKGIIKKGGMKAAEVEWSGLEEWLEEKGTEKITKQELNDFLDANNLEVTEIDIANKDPLFHRLEQQEADLRNEIQSIGLDGEGEDLMATVKDLEEGISEYKVQRAGTPEEIGLEMQERRNIRNQLNHAQFELNQYYERRFKAQHEMLAQVRKQMDDMVQKDDPQYERWTITGGDDYKEILFQLPSRITNLIPNIVLKAEKNVAGFYQVQLRDGSKFVMEYAATEQDAIDQFNRKVQTGEFRISDLHSIDANFENPHFRKYENVFAHTRTKNRITDEGNKMLFMEEVQSDWARKGRKEGYAVSLTRENITTKYFKGVVPEGADPENYPGYWESYYPNGEMIVRHPGRYNEESVIREALQYTEAFGVPNMPFKTNWQEFAIKSLIRKAAESGYNEFGWATGKQIAKMYDLSNHISRVRYGGKDNALLAYDLKGELVISKDGIQPDDLENYIGKEAALKLVQQERADTFEVIHTRHNRWAVQFTGGGQYYGFADPNTKKAAMELMKEAEKKYFYQEIDGLDLKVGGEWAVNLYDKTIPNFLKKYGKKWGASVKTSVIPTRRWKIERINENIDPELIGYQSEKDQWAIVDTKGNNRYVPPLLFNSAQDAADHMNRSSADDDGNMISIKRHPNGFHFIWSNADGYFKFIKGDVYQWTEGVYNATQFEKQSHAEANMKKFFGEAETTEVHSMEITPAMRESVLYEGQPMFNAVDPRKDQDRSRLDKYVQKILTDMPPTMDPSRMDRLNELTEKNKSKNVVLTPEEKVELKNLQKEKKGFAALDPFLRRRLSTDLKNRIKLITTGYNMGSQEMKSDLQRIKADIGRYARLFLPRGSFMKSDITGLISKVIHAKDPKSIGEAFDKIREVENKVRRRTILSAFNKLIRKADPEKGDPQFVTWIKQIRRMTAVQVQAEMDRVLNETAPKNMDMTEAQDEYFYLLNKYSDIMNKSTDDLEELYLELAAEMEAGRSKRKAWLNAEKERKAELREQTIQVITGGKGVLDVDEARDVGLLKDAQSIFDNMSALGTVTHSWEMTMDKLSKRHPSEPFRSFLNEKWAVDVHKARNQEGSGVRRTMDQVRTKLLEIYQTTSKRTIVNEMEENSVRQETGATRWKVLERDEAGLPTERKKINLNLSQNEAAHILMAYEDPGLANTFEKWGFDEQTISDLRNFVKSKVMKWARWQVEEFYPNYYPGVDSVYFRIRGAHLPFNSKYIPIRREVSRNVTDAEFLGDVTEFVSIINGSLLPRIANTRQLKIMDIDRVLLEHIVTMEHFKAFAPIMQDMRAVFGSEPVRAAIKQYHGSVMLKVINRFINDFARGGVDRKNTFVLMDQIRSNFIKSVIGVNPVVTIKQLASIPAYAMDIPIKDFMLGVVQFASNPIPKIKFLMKNSEMLKTRYHKGWERDIILAMKRARKTTAKELTRKFTFTDAAMMFTKFGDGAAILVGGWGTYNYWKKKMLKEGKTPEQAHEKAMLEFEMSTKRAQQAGDVEDLGELQRQGSFQKMFTIFMTAPKQYFSNASAAYRNILYRRGSFAKNLKRILIAHSLLPMLFQFVSDGFRWDKDHMLRAAVLGSVNGILILGDILEVMFSALQGDVFWEFDETPIGSMVGDGKEAMKKMYEITQSNKFYLDEVLETADAVADAVSKPFGIPYQPVKKLTQGIMDFTDAPDSVSYLRLFGYSKRLFEEEPILDPMVEEIKQDEKRLKKLRSRAREMPKIQEYIEEANDFEIQLNLKKKNSDEWKKYQEEQKLERKEKKKNDPFQKPTTPKTKFGKKLFKPKLNF